MLIAFETKNSKVLDSFLNNFLDPVSIWKQFVHAFAYTSKKVTRVNSLVIIEMVSFIDIIAKYSLISSVGMFIIGMFIQSALLLNLGSFFILITLAVLSKSVRSILFRLALRSAGHKDKISFKSNAEVIELLLYSREVYDVSD